MVYVLAVTSVAGVALCAFAPLWVGAPARFVFANLALYALGTLLFAQAVRSTRARRERGRPARMTPSNRLLQRIGILLVALACLVTLMIYNVPFADMSL